MKVLLADDDAANRHVVKLMLTRMGHAVDAVGDGVPAVTAAASGDYDLILMDMEMPQLGGLAATRMIRAGAPPRCLARVVGLTANTLASDRANCEAAGMNGFVTKPIAPEQLRAMLRQQDPVRTAPPEAPLDVAFLEELANDIGSNEVAEIVRAFVEDAPGHMAAIETAFARGAVQKLRREAHALNGAARNIGLTRVAHAASELQEICGAVLPEAADIEAVAIALRKTLPLATAWADEHESPDRESFVR